MGSAWRKVDDLLSGLSGPRRLPRKGQPKTMLVSLHRVHARNVVALACASCAALFGCEGAIGGALGPSGAGAGQPSATGGSNVGGAGTGGVMTSSVPFAPSPPALPRLTTAQYRNVIGDLFGPRVQIPELEPDQR